MISTIALTVLLGRSIQSAEFTPVWREVSKEISALYYARKTRKPEMDRLLAKYKQIACAARTRDQFESAVNKMCGEFGDSHFEFFSNDDQGYYLMDGLRNHDDAKHMPEVGAWFKRGPDGYIVSMVLNGSAAEKAGLRKGDRILTVDDKPFSPVKAFRSSIDSEVEVRVARDGKRFTAKMAVSSESALQMFQKATEDSIRVMDVDGRHIGYIHLWTQASEAFRSVLNSAVYGKLSGTAALILDLRDGFGGGYDGFIDPFFRPDVSITLSSPDSSSTTHFGYGRPMALLINEGSRSAKEMVAELFKVSKRAKLIGTKTAGNVIAASPILVADWAYLEIPAIDIHMDGIRLEKNGVKPDIEVPREYDESGKDLVLGRAIEELKGVPTSVRETLAGFNPH